MAYLGVTVDGRSFRVRIVKDTYREHIDFIEGPLNGDMESGRHERDLKGVSATYYMTVEPDYRYLQDYDDLWTLLRQPVDSHSVTVIENQDFNPPAPCGAGLWTPALSLPFRPISIHPPRAGRDYF